MWSRRGRLGVGVVIGDGAKVGVTLPFPVLALFSGRAGSVGLPVGRAGSVGRAMVVLAVIGSMVVLGRAGSVGRAMVVLAVIGSMVVLAVVVLVVVAVAVLLLGVVGFVGAAVVVFGVAVVFCGAAVGLFGAAVVLSAAAAAHAQTRCRGLALTISQVTSAMPPVLKFCAHVSVGPQYPYVQPLLSSAYPPDFRTVLPSAMTAALHATALWATVCMAMASQALVVVLIHAAVQLSIAFERKNSVRVPFQR